MKNRTLSALLVEIEFLKRNFEKVFKLGNRPAYPKFLKYRAVQNSIKYLKSLPIMHFFADSDVFHKYKQLEITHSSLRKD